MNVSKPEWCPVFICDNQADLVDNEFDSYADSWTMNQDKTGTSQVRNNSNKREASAPLFQMEHKHQLSLVLLLWPALELFQDLLLLKQVSCHFHSLLLFLLFFYHSLFFLSNFFSCRKNFWLIFWSCLWPRLVNIYLKLLKNFEFFVTLIKNFHKIEKLKISFSMLWFFVENSSLTPPTFTQVYAPLVNVVLCSKILSKWP